MLAVLVVFGIVRLRHDVIVTVVFFAQLRGHLLGVEGAPHVDWRGIEGDGTSEGFRQHSPYPRLISILEVVETFERAKGGDTERRILSLLNRIPTSEHLQSLVQGRAVQTGVNAGGDTDAVLEAEQRTVIEREQILCEVGKLPEGQVSIEPVGQPEVTLFRPQRLCCRQRHQVEFDLRIRPLRKQWQAENREKECGSDQTQNGREDQGNRSEARAVPQPHSCKSLYRRRLGPKPAFRFSNGLRRR